MPIEVKDYTWDETDTLVNISVPLKGVKVEKVDILSTNEYLKVSFPPYIFESLLYAPVIETKSTAYIQSGLVFFRLEKVTGGLWSQLNSELIQDKEYMKKKREEAIFHIQQKLELEQLEKQEEKRTRSKYALNEQMKLEQEERERILSIKENEKKKATEELEQWKEMQRQQALLEKSKLEEEKLKMQVENAKKLKETVRASGRKEKTGGSFDNENEITSVRDVGKISVKFTPRVFPTASRESTKDVEEEWLRKQAEARRAAELEDEDLTEEEKNPVAMKEKGDRFFKTGDILAAISAYTHAIRLSRGKMPSLYSNRAACHLRIRNLMKAIEDSSKALELLTPPVTQNAMSRCKAHVRRGTAFCEMELYVEGLQDFEAALKLDPTNESLMTDTKRIRAVIEGRVRDE